MSDRKISINKNDLLIKIKENKKLHIEEYGEAIIAYKAEALKQLETLKAQVSIDGKLDIQLNLVTPVDNTNHYDKLISMFEWETKEIVELSKSEFNAYVLDETQTSLNAKFYNSTYTN